MSENRAPGGIAETAGGTPILTFPRWGKGFVSPLPVRRQHFENLLLDGFYLTQHLVVPEPQNMDSLFLQARIRSES